MYKLCPNCHYFGKAKCNVSRVDLYSGIFLTLVGILALTVDADILGSRVIYVLMMLYVLVIGIYEIFGYYYGSNRCPKCNNNGMLPLNNPEALKLIKQFDLKVGENSPPNAQIEPKTDTLETPKS